MTTPEKPKTQKLKKSETLEIRIPYPTKAAFMARCREQDRSASEVLRSMIESHLAPPSPPRREAPAGRAAGTRGRTLRRLAGAAIAGAVGMAALPSLARPSLHAEFNRLDADGDGRVTEQEFAGGAAIEVRMSVPAASAKLDLAHPGQEGLATSGLRTLAAGAALDQQIRTLLLRTEFRRLDADRDGEVSLEEYRQRYEAAGRAPDDKL